MKQKILTLFLLFVLLFSNSADYAYAAKTEPLITGKSAVLIDAATGEILFEKNMHSKQYPASTTKMMTAILTLENLDLKDKVEIDNEVPFTEGSKIYLLEGENVIVKDVMYAMMLESANDAAAALGKNISGTTEEFVKLMNKKAKELGALNTNFVNAHGLHDDEHVSTAYDLAMIAMYAMKNETFRDYVQTYKYTMEATNLQETRYFYNTNRMLYDDLHKVVVRGVERGCKYEGITGIKTGYTSKAGGCLVASAKRDDTELIAVTLASDDMGRFQDCIEMLDYGFENFKTVKVYSQGDSVGGVKVKRGTDKFLDLVLASDIYVTLPLEASTSILSTIAETPDFLEAPVEAGQEAGVLKIYAGDEVVGEHSVFTASEMERGGLLSVFGLTQSQAKKVKITGLTILSIIILLLVAIILIRRRQMKINRRRRQLREERLRLMKEREKQLWEDNFWNRRG